MRLLVILEGRFCRAPDGGVWTGAAFPYSFWTRYLEVFEHVTVVARISEAKPRPGDVRSDGPNVTFAPIPYYVGPLRYLAKRRAIRLAMGASLAVPGAVIMRVVPCTC